MACFLIVPLAAERGALRDIQKTAARETSFLIDL